MQMTYILMPLRRIISTSRLHCPPKTSAESGTLDISKKTAGLQWDTVLMLFMALSSSILY